ncbi:WG repeat-containing protein [Ruminococcus albus]|uniref:WG containing repeat-containing protein n=1 Tax=Ruminococcus albus (strain ATCC 27210 / DSM 20455 / JCM 14654 / NCDO 2250 / 7) TaxID=697329 RepID=E6UIT9_RUMA7|nr:WG repeat-containing protein [Ruminococcus albus]ADU21391.1 hypothetical protein Rumal_0864 [Ruminococcus albus 7 = DSM 20455]
MKNSFDKKLAVLLAAAMTISLSACSNSDDDKDDNSDKSAVTTTEKATSNDGENETTAPEDSDSEAETEPPKELEPEDPPAEYEIKSPVLEKANEFDLGKLNFYNNTCIYTGDSNDNIDVYDINGKKLLGGGVKLVTQLKYTEDVYTFTKFEGDMTYEGLMDADGNEILSIDEHVGTFESINKRFVKAYIPEGATTNEDEAIYYVTPNQFSITPGNNDTFYKGTVKIYDLENKKFLENTACTFDPRVTVYGDIISFYDADNNTVYVNADDEVLEFDSDFVPVGEDFLIGSKDGKYVVADHSMNEIIATDYNVNNLDNSDYYYIIRDYENSKSGIMSEKGRTIIEPKYDQIYNLSEGYFQYNTGENYGILKADGTELTPADYHIISEPVPGFFTCRTKDNVSSLVDRTGKVLYTESGDDSLYTLDTPYYLSNGEYNYLILGTGEFSLKLKNSGTYLGKNMLYVYQDHVVYDLVTGEKLFEDIDKASMAYGRLCIVKDGKVTVYNVK